jgi:hypothetical protein
MNSRNFCNICETFGHLPTECNCQIKIIKQLTYENQRWFPLVGWGSKRLPTDRFEFSSEDGKTELQKELFILQNNETIVYDWQINLENCDNEGWEYAIDFPATYSPTNSKLCCVRRRKWIRTIKIHEPKNNNSNQFIILGEQPDNKLHLENESNDKQDTMFDPKYDICFKCGGKGHNANNCTKKLNVQSDPFFRNV